MVVYNAQEFYGLKRLILIKFAIMESLPEIETEKFCARFLSFSFPFNRSMQKEISTIEIITVSVRPFARPFRLCWTMDNGHLSIRCICVLLILVTTISSHKVEDSVILQVQSGEK